jgi:hypothetical protein
VRFALALSLLLGAAPFVAPLSAQNLDPHLEIIVNPTTIMTEGPAIVAAGLLSNPTTKDLLVNGPFPTGIAFRLQLWRKGGLLGDDLMGQSDWSVLVQYEPTKQTFNVIRQTEQAFENFGGFPNLASAEAQLARPLRIGPRPDRAGRFYYNLIVDVQALTETDLDALQHWARGTKSQGSSNVLSALGRGVRSLLSRTLGGDKRRIIQQSGVFVVP